MRDLIYREDAIKAVWGDDINPSEDGVVFEAQSHIDRDIRLIPSADMPHSDDWERYSDRLWKKAYERGKAEAWRIAQIVFDSTVTLYEAEDVARMKGADDEAD